MVEDRRLIELLLSNLSPTEGEPVRFRSPAVETEAQFDGEPGQRSLLSFRLYGGHWQAPYFGCANQLRGGFLYADPDLGGSIYEYLLLQTHCDSEANREAQVLAADRLGFIPVIHVLP